MTLYNNSFLQFCRNVSLVSRCSGTLLILFGFSLNSLLGYWSFNLTCDPVSIGFSNAIIWNKWHDIRRYAIRGSVVTSQGCDLRRSTVHQDLSRSNVMPAMLVVCPCDLWTYIRPCYV